MKNSSLTFMSGRALRGMRNAIAQKKHDMRHALLACLLIYCVETLQGNPATGTRHARSGLNLLHEWMSKSKQQAAGREFAVQQNQNKPQFQAQNTLDMDVYHGPEDTVESRRLFSFYGFERDIFNAFAALEIQIWTSIDDVPGKGLSYLGRLHQALLGNMPESFKTLAESRQCWLKIRSMNYHWKIDASDEGQPIYADWPGLEPNIDRINSWFSASANVFADLEIRGTQEEKIYASKLKVEAYSEFMALSGSTFKSEKQYESLTPYYKIVVELCEEIYPALVRAQSAQPLVTGELFGFDVGTINGLRLLIYNCRDTTLRDRAIALLKHSCYREGLVDAQATAFIADWHWNIKEKMRKADAFTTLDKRVVITRQEIDSENKTISLSARSIVPGRGKWKWKEKLDWKFGPGRPSGVAFHADDESDDEAV